MRRARPRLSLNDRSEASLSWFRILCLLGQRRRLAPRLSPTLRRFLPCLRRRSPRPLLAGGDESPLASQHTTPRLNTFPAPHDFQRDCYCTFCRRVKKSRPGGNWGGAFRRKEDGREFGAACSDPYELLTRPALYAKARKVGNLAMPNHPYLLDFKARRGSVEAPVSGREPQCLPIHFTPSIITSYCELCQV